MLGKEVTSRQAQAHISKATQTNFIAKDGWPVNFFYLNPIDNIWSIID